jgi:hypothetical protein
MCGASLSSVVETGSGPVRMAASQEQPGLPAWLESLRAGERSAAPANNPSNFSTADLIDDGALPSWMRSGRPDVNDAAVSSPHLTLRPSSTPGPNTDDSKGINAKSLIDESSLPSWMQENRQATGPIPQGGIAASSLVQPDFVPDWMKASHQQQSPVSNSGMPSMQPMPPQPPALSAQYRQPAQPGRPDEFAQQPPQGFSAGGLIDQQSLPPWMTRQEKKNPAVSGVESAAPGGLSPSSLLDMNAVPSWMRESGQQEQRSGGFPPVQPNQPWQAASPAMQTPPLQNPSGPTSQQPMWVPPAPGQGNSLSASSFIDPNSLPEWLRSGNEQRQAGGLMPQQQSPAINPRSGYGVSPRVENIRVPSRPRGELNPNEGNEAAANVFASMLGVASTAPNFPGSPAGQPYGMQSPSPGGNMPGQMPAGAQGPQRPQGYAPGGYNSGIYQTGNPGQQGNYQMGNPSAGANQYPMAGMSPRANAAGMPGNEMGTDQRSATKPAKKGFFETVRDWFR